MPLLDVQDLTVEFPTRRGTLRALDRVSFSIDTGEILGIVGESGAGKSLTGAAIVGLLERPGRIAGGEVRLERSKLDRTVFRLEIQKHAPSGPHQTVAEQTLGSLIVAREASLVELPGTAIPSGEK